MMVYFGDTALVVNITIDHKWFDFVCVVATYALTVVVKASLLDCSQISPGIVSPEIILVARDVLDVPAEFL